VTNFPDRIDFIVLNDGRVIVLKLRRDTASDPAVPRDIPITDSVKPAGFDLEGALEWCRTHDYTVRPWPGGARAWHAPTPWVIRTRNQIMRLRDRHPGAQMDFAYDK
jgi:hypothetical protein